MRLRVYGRSLGTKKYLMLRTKYGFNVEVLGFLVIS